MSQQPIRITRLPKPAADAPTDRLDGSTVPSDAAVCPSCGAYVADADLHAAHHDGTDRWVESVTEVMRLLLEREGVPTDGESPTSSGNPAGQ